MVMGSSSLRYWFVHDGRVGITVIKVNLASPGSTKTNLNGYAETEFIEDGSREVVRVALLRPEARQDIDALGKHNDPQ